MSDDSLPPLPEAADSQRGPTHDHPAEAGNRALVAVIGLIAVVYLLLVSMHSPLLFGQAEVQAAVEHAEIGRPTHPPYWMVAPFVLLLGAIAIMPLAPHASHWWES